MSQKISCACLWMCVHTHAYKCIYKIQDMKAERESREGKMRAQGKEKWVLEKLPRSQLSKHPSIAHVAILIPKPSLAASPKNLLSPLSVYQPSTLHPNPRS